MTASTRSLDFMFQGIPPSWQPRQEPPLDPPEDVNLDAYAYGEQAEREIRDTLNRYSDPDFLVEIDWNLDDVELSPDRKYVYVQQVVRSRIPFGALYK